MSIHTGSDVIDASVTITVADSGHHDNEAVLLTSDPGDMRTLHSALDADARILEV